MDLLLVLSKFIYLLSATLTVGFLIAIVFFAQNQNGLIRNTHLTLRNKVAAVAWIWAGSSSIFILATLASILNVGIGAALDFTMLRSFVTQISLGKFLAIQTVGALIIALLITKINRITYAALILMVSLAALAAPIFQSHSASGGSHLVAIGTLIVHVIAISMWVGGLLAILFSKELNKNLALQRFSQLAFWAALAVVSSGVINAWIRMNFSGAWQGAYAILISEKILLTLLLLILAAFARKRLAGNINKLIAIEGAVMVLTLFIGTLLSQSKPPTKPGIVDPIESLVGLRYPGTPTLQKFIFDYQPDALTLALLILAALLYLKGIRIMRKRGDKWSMGRSLSFFSGILVINYAINGAIGVYAHFGFSYHMIEHMILGMIAPIFIVLELQLPWRLELCHLEEMKRKRVREIY